MFTKEVLDLLIQVIRSWQVLFITITLVLYMCLVNYVARTYHRPHTVSKSKPKRVKRKEAPVAVPAQVDISDDEDSIV